MVLAVFEQLLNFGVFFLSKKKEKNYCFEKVKIEEKEVIFFKDWTTSFKYHIYGYSMHFMILLICFVSCNILGLFSTF